MTGALEDIANGIGIKLLANLIALIQATQDHRSPNCLKSRNGPPLEAAIVLESGGRDLADNYRLSFRTHNKNIKTKRCGEHNRHFNCAQ
jgi:hypothetical protein